MDFRCTTDRYDALYAPWLANPGALLDLGGYRPGQALLDLCGGTGAVSREALRRGADPSTITLLDINPRCPDTRIRQVVGSAETLGYILGREVPCEPPLFHAAGGIYDLIVCRQAINYLRFRGLPGCATFSWVAVLLKYGGKFVFDTFVRPEWRFRVRSKSQGGRRFYEAAFRVGERIYHLQGAPGVGADVTVFDWYPPKFFWNGLAPFFDCEVRKTDRSYHWICTRKKSPC